MLRTCVLILLSVASAKLAFGQCVVSVSTIPVSCSGFCDGEAFTTTYGSEPFTYLWSTGATSTSIAGLCPGTYSVTMVDDTGCVAVSNFEIFEPAPIVVTATLVSGPTLPGACDAVIEYNVTGGVSPYQFAWFDCATALDSGWIGTAPPWSTCAGDWAITAMDGNGCLVTSSCIAVQEVVLAVGDNLTMQDGYSVRDGAVHFTRAVSDIQVFDSSGRTLWFDGSGTRSQVDLSSLGSGIHIMRYTIGTGHAQVVKLQL